ncbi:MAG TPA: NAD(P)-binding domain-containing protein [Candidatus Limnocylindria bacterium]|nr:NAD(P)-binding domain-containing protein [Candidatus Limnocylindria bacterium]
MPPRTRTKDPVDRTDAWAVIGAGAHGLAAVKALREQGIAVQGYEREDDLGGNWNERATNSRVYPSTHLISSKAFTAYPDFPMPDSYPDYPHQRQAHTYFSRYADHFGLREDIRFGTEVVRVEPYVGPDGVTRWDVTTKSGRKTMTERFEGVVIANGHNWNPKMPDYPALDDFRAQGGTVLHSADYKGPEVLRDKRVLVVGAGNTGCDLAVESAQQAAQTFHSMRRGYYFNPKFTQGSPSDQVNDRLLLLRVPLPVRRALYKATHAVVIGNYAKLGLRVPDHKFYETHPIVNSLLVYYVGQGDISPRPDIARFEGRTAVFADDTRAEVDLVLLCTGYLVDFGFLDAHAHLNWRDTHPHLFQHIFTPAHDTLAVSGLIQPDSGQWCLAHWQAVTIATFARARRDRPEAAAAFFARVGEHADARFTGGTTYKESSRHYYEVQHQDYLASLEHTINELEGSRPYVPAGGSS